MPMPLIQKSADPGSLPGSGRGPAWRGLILLTLTVLLVGGFFYVMTFPCVAPQEMTQAQLFELIKEDRVTSIVNEPAPSTGIRMLTGTYKKAVNAVPGAPDNGEGAFKVPVDLSLNPYLASEIKQAGYSGIIETQINSNILWPLIINFLPILLLGGWMLFILVCLTRLLYKAAFGPRGT
jgi:hypothetical protein